MQEFLEPPGEQGPNLFLWDFFAKGADANKICCETKNGCIMYRFFASFKKFARDAVLEIELFYK